MFHTDTRPHPDPDGVGGRGADSRLVVTLRAACGGVCLCLAAGAHCLRHNGTKGVWTALPACGRRDARDSVVVCASVGSERLGRSADAPSLSQGRSSRRHVHAAGDCWHGVGRRLRATQLVVVSSSCATLLQPQVMRPLCLRCAAIVRAVRRRPLDRLADRFAIARTPVCRCGQRDAPVVVSRSPKAIRPPQSARAVPTLRESISLLFALIPPAVRPPKRTSSTTPTLFFDQSRIFSRHIEHCGVHCTAGQSKANVNTKRTLLLALGSCNS